MWSITKRPHVLSDVRGNEKVKKYFYDLVKEKSDFPKAVIFQGLTGSGKTTSAKIIAQMLVCKNPKENGDPCCECPACKAIIDETYNRSVMQLDGRNIGIDDLRDKVTPFVITPSITDRNKVIIIEELQEMGAEAQKYFLKTIENPQNNIYFIFTTMTGSKKSAALDKAFINRCVRFLYNEANISELMDYALDVLKSEPKVLEEIPEMEQEKFYRFLQAIAENSGGSYRQCIQLLEQCVKSGVYDPIEIMREFGLTDEGAFFDVVIELLDGKLSDKSFTYLTCGDAKTLESMFSLVYKIIADAELYRLFGKIPDSFKKDNKSNEVLGVKFKTVFGEKIIDVDNSKELFVDNDSSLSWKLKQCKQIAFHKNFNILRDCYYRFADFERLMPSHIRMLICEVYRKCHENLESEKMSAGHIRNLENQAARVVEPVQQEPAQVEAKETKRIVRR